MTIDPRVGDRAAGEAPRADAGKLHIRLLGALEVRREGVQAALPPSRKTRALLAYLAVAARPQRRERLCELFWDVPDDPRGALRWSLSKLRGLLDAPGAPVVSASREAVSLTLANGQVDYLSIRAALKGGVDAGSTPDLERVATLFQGPFLADLDLPQHPQLQSWIVGTREELRALHAAVLRALDDRHASEPQTALPYARELVQLDPLVEESWARLLQRLRQLGRRREVDEQYAAAQAALREVGGATRVLDEARRPSDPERVAAPPAQPVFRQEIRFCHAADGVRLAYATAGAGPPLVKAANWLNHLEYDWESPIWGHFLRGLAQTHRLLRYDSRGNGLSDPDPEVVSFEASVHDLETVVDAAGYDRFPLLGVSQGCAISIAYAVRHPERVSHLVLYAGFAVGAHHREPQQEWRERRKAMLTLMRLGWGQSNPAFRQMFTTLFIPEATREQADAFNELQRRTTTPELAARQYEVSAEIDVRRLLHQVSAPTLVLHTRGDAVIPIELGRQMAAGIPGARFVPLPGQNHLFLEDEPTAERFFEEFRNFLRS